MTTRSHNFERQTTRILWHIVLANRRAFLLSLINFAGVIGVNVIVPLLVSITLAGMVTRQGDIVTYLIPLAVATVFGVLLNWIGFTYFLRLQAKVQADALELAMRTLLNRSVGFHTNTVGGKLVSNAIDYPNALSKLLDVTYVNAVPFAITITVGIGIILSRSIVMGLGLLTVVATTITLVIVQSRKRKRLRVARKVAQNEMIANASDTIVNAQAVKTFASESREMRSHNTFSHRLADLRLRDWTIMARNGSSRMGSLLGLQILFIGLVGYLLRRDPSVLAIGIFSFSYMITLTNRLFELSAMIRSVEEAFVSSASMTEIIQQDAEIVDVPDARPLSVSHGSIALQNVQFAYHDEASAEDVFHDLTLDIPAGQKVGLVGPSGGGKSTLTRLLLRFDDIDEGIISIDDQDIKTVTQRSLRQAISYVPQEPLLFHRTIAENIAYGKPNAKQSEIKQAAKLAFADEFIEKLPKGYDTIVGERGVKLSGGQRQRVAIARAILKDAPILILDEATSALDSESEVYIQRALEQLMQGRTTIVIAHRLSTIQKMDRIIVLNDGAIIEDDTHAKLLESNGLYATLWAHQSGGFIEED